LLLKIEPTPISHFLPQRLKGSKFHKGDMVEYQDFVFP